MHAIDEPEKIELTPRLARQLYEELQDTLQGTLTIHETMYWDEGSGSWTIEFYTGAVFGSDIRIVGNAYIPEARGMQIRELKRIAGAEAEELPEVLASDDEEYRWAAANRMQELKRQGGDRAKIKEGLKALRL